MNSHSIRRILQSFPRSLSTMATSSKSRTPIHLPGTTLEGGGQLLRIALALSALTKTPIHMDKIRGNRSGGDGLKAQHLTSLSWLGLASNARISGAGLKSKEITFTPRSNPSPISYLQSLNGEIRITQSTPGSTSLILQAILPYILFYGYMAPIHLRITGGTNVSNSPSYEYITHVLLPMLSLIGLPRITSTLQSRGWSQGNTCLGSVAYTIPPLACTLPGFNLTQRGEIISVDAYIISPRTTEREWNEHLTYTFSNTLAPQINTTVHFEPSHHEKRYYILLVATSSTGIKLGRDWLYDQAIRPGKTEKIVPSMIKKVMLDLQGEIGHGGCVDEYMRDQLVIFQVLAKGRSTVYGGAKRSGSGSGEGEVNVEPSLHARTGMWVCGEMLGVEFDDGGGCVGIGFEPGGACGEQREDAGEEDEVIDGVARLEV